MTKATASPKVDRTIVLRDGRQMAYSEWGDLGGRPVVLIHGSPGSRLLCPDEEATVAAGVRLITIDRRGYGRSDPKPGGTLLNWPDDYVEFTEQIALPPCPIVGWSAGGRYAMALAVREPDLVPVVGLAVSVGPINEVPGAFENLSDHDQEVAALLRKDHGAGLATIQGDFQVWLENEGWESLFTESWGESDDRVLADPVTLAAQKALMREAFRQGTTGFEADEIEVFTPWGFLVADIRQPVHIWSGGSDSMVRPADSIYLAASIPRTNLITYPDEGHLLPFRHWGEMLTALQ
jgi:pimeloyl-ACP methyl ester carboxylesterase